MSRLIFRHLLQPVTALELLGTQFIFGLSLAYHHSWRWRHGIGPASASNPLALPLSSGAGDFRLSEPHGRAVPRFADPVGHMTRRLLRGAG